MQVDPLVQNFYVNWKLYGRAFCHVTLMLTAFVLFSGSAHFPRSDCFATFPCVDMTRLNMQKDGLCVMQKDPTMKTMQYSLDQPIQNCSS